MCFLHTFLYGGLTYKPKYMTIKSKTSKNAQTAVCLPSETLVEILSTQWHGFVNTMVTESAVSTTGAVNRCQYLANELPIKTFSHDTVIPRANRHQPPEAHRLRSRTKTRTPTKSLANQHQEKSLHESIVMVQQQSCRDQASQDHLHKLTMAQLLWDTVRSRLANSSKRKKLYVRGIKSILVQMNRAGLETKPG